MSIPGVQCIAVIFGGSISQSLVNMRSDVIVSMAIVTRYT